MLRRPRIQKQPGRFNRRTTNNHDLRFYLLLLLGSCVNKTHAPREPRLVHQDFTSESVLAEREVPGPLRLRQHGHGAVEYRPHLTSVLGLAAVVTWRATVIDDGDDGFAHRNERNPHALGCPMQDLFASAPRKGRPVVFP